MSNKQSNSQSVKVTVNNKINCCDADKKKKRRKPRRKQQQEEASQEVNEFPVLDTPANTRYPQMSIAPMAVRNTVYLPNTAQITPEGMQYPIPPYFERQYTNLTRTMEDFRDTMMKEMQDVRNLVSVKPVSNAGTQTVTDMETQTYIPQSTMQTQPDGMFDEQQPISPVKSMINRFESLGINDDEEEMTVPLQEEEPFVSKSPEQSRLYSKYLRLYKEYDEIDKNDKQAKEDNAKEIRDFAESIGVNLYNENGRLRSVQQLRNDIKNKVKE